MNQSERFHGLLRVELSPKLRRDGFRGSGNTYWRVSGERVDVVSVQGSRYGDACCVNLGAHYLFLPSEGGGVTDLRKFKEYHCVFRERLREEGEEDHWWYYGENEAAALAGAAGLLDTYTRRAGLFYARFGPFPEVFERITPAQLDAGDFSQMPPGPTQVIAILTMARMMLHLGQPDRCREFAEVGLRQAGLATGLIPELERLRDAVA
jgi:hypothetical protein